MKITFVFKIILGLETSYVVDLLMFAYDDEWLWIKHSGYEAFKGDKN